MVRSLKASPVNSVRVVLGYRSDEIAAHLEGTDAETVFNPRYPEGMLTSVQAGIAASPAETEWFLIALGDQPSLSPAVVTMLVAKASLLVLASDSPDTILVPSYGGRRGHPLLIHASHRDEIATLDPQVGLRELMQRHPEAIHHVDVPDEAVLADMDTPDDYQRELKRLESRSSEG